MNKIKNVLYNKSHPLWVFIQQFALRGLLGIKFLLIARLLDPVDVGLITIALISLTLTEALTEMGLMQAIVQNKNRVEHIRVIWTLQFIRGFIITVILLILNNYVVILFNEPDAKYILFLAAFVPLIKNVSSSNFYYAVRDKNFKVISIIYGLTGLIDLVGSIILIAIFKDPIFAIASLLIAELIKSILTHVVFGWTIKFDFRFYLIKDLLVYGRWIWGNSISSFFVNQFDKIIASTFLGTKILGLYQMGQKVTQMAIADISFAAGQYLFPQFSQMYRNNNNDRNLKKFYSNVMLLMIGFSVVISSFVIIYAKQIILIVFGIGWEEMNNIIKLMIISSSLSAITYVSVVYNRAIGKPKKVTIVSYIQLIVFVSLCFILVHPLNINGLILGNIISYLLGLLLLNYSFENKIKYVINSVKENYVMVIVTTGIIALMLTINKVTPSILGFFLSLVFLMFGVFYLGQKFMKRRPTDSLETM
ncbi:oligosaccharide flippase family protein [Paenibacillus abyssi]|uniref:Lipopolysaccharide biosynthesis protein n=1 Tax=Paenibacillus abyssi TaxID=1340531 RepID=A0A917G3W6_9BACL|nr:oligosaccharide flippase family protein [Paenibacillus abyssi]GGG21702.1 lipopolysaccharide biosynthesis protein [Paenibacillus abyssi]